MDEKTVIQHNGNDEIRKTSIVASIDLNQNLDAK
jgi:hypothetical protein